MPDNFSVAREADKYVRDQMLVKAGNRDADGISANLFDAAEQTKRPLEDQIADAGIADDAMIDCLAWAAVAQRSHISNCLGMASLAFAWIALKYPASRPVGVYGFRGSTLDQDGGVSTITKRTMAITGLPLEMNQNRVQILNGVRTETPAFTADHAICIIGDPRLDGGGRVTAAGAYVCDPWARRVYDAVSLEMESSLIARVTGGSASLVLVARRGDNETLSNAVRAIIGIPQ
jgi:hypothetical protein